MLFPRVLLVLCLLSPAALAGETPPASNGNPSSAASVPPAAPATAPAPTEGQSFDAEVKLLFRVVACGSDAPLPPGIDSPTVEAHCKQLSKHIEKYRKQYVEEASKFIAALRPAGLPSRVVYPFGGGDLLSALTTYPDATEITTLSLEYAGDPRRLGGIDKARLAASLSLIRRTSAGLLLQNDSTSENLSRGQQGEIPGQLAFFLIALSVHGYEPVGLRYFRLEPSGTIHYLSAEEIASMEGVKANPLHTKWVAPDFSEAFSNAEIRFVPKGAAPGAPVRVHRHIAANLGDEPLTKDPSLLHHLEQKGRICAMTKAASYLLWRDSCSKIRDYLLAHMDFMVSDSTGIPVKFAKKTGFVQETFGHFAGSFLGASEEHNLAFRELWSSQPQRKLPFRYGYLDSDKKYHMLITRPVPKVP